MATTTTSTPSVYTATPAAPVYAYPTTAVGYGAAPRIGDFWDRRQTFGNVYAQPFWPQGGWTPANQPVASSGAARVGDFWDRRQCFGNVSSQPFFPWSGQAPAGRIGDSYDRRYTFGNVYQQPFVPAAGPIGPALGYHYADSAYRVGIPPPGTAVVGSGPFSYSTAPAGGKEHAYPFA